jgi:hypothetical protein
MKKLFWIVYILCIPLFAFAQTDDAEYNAVASQDVNVRSERNAESSKVMTLIKGTKVIVKGSITVTWVIVSYEGKSGYVNKRFLSIDETPIKKDTKEKKAEPSKKAAVTVDMEDLLTVEHIAFLLICIAMLIFIIMELKAGNIGGAEFLRMLLASAVGGGIVFLIVRGFVSIFPPGFKSDSDLVSVLARLHFYNYNDLYVNCVANAFIIAFAGSFGAIAGGFAGFLGYFFALSNNPNMEFVMLTSVFPAFIGMLSGLFAYGNRCFLNIDDAMSDLGEILKLSYFWNIASCLIAYFCLSDMAYKARHFFEGWNWLIVIGDVFTGGLVGAIIDIKEFFTEWLPNFWLGIIIGIVLCVILMALFYRLKAVINYDVEQSSDNFLTDFVNNHFGKYFAFFNKELIIKILKIIGKIIAFIIIAGGIIMLIAHFL